METDITSKDILKPTPNDVVSVNCSRLAMKMDVGEPIQSEGPAI